MLSTSERHGQLTPLAAGLALTLATGATAGAGPNSTSIPSTGQDLSIQLTAPADGAVVPVPPGSIDITGRATVGEAPDTPTNLLYVLDVSSSTEDPQGLDCNADGTVDVLDDFNAAGAYGEVLDCEVQGVLSLNQSLAGSADVAAGLIVFARDAATADIDPAVPGDQVFATSVDADANGNGLPDIDEVARSLRNGLPPTILPDLPIGVEEFAPKVVTNGTDFSAPLAAIYDAFEPLAEYRNIAYFLTDGFQTATAGIAPALILADELARLGVQVNTYSVGPNGSGCDAGAADIRLALLAQIADMTGGTCTEIRDPSQLGSAIAGAVPVGLDRVEVDGSTVDVNAVGDFAARFTCPASGGIVTVTAVAFADDADPVTGAQTSIAADLSLDCGTAANTPPLADAGPDQTLECASPDGTQVTLNGGGSSDPDDDPLDYLWSSAVFGSADGVSITRPFPIGSSSVLLTVTDDDGEQDDDSLLVTVRDTLAPDLTPPPDLTLTCASTGGTSADIGTATVTDACDAAPAVSNDAPALFSTGDTLVTWTATDSAGNTASAVQTVSVVGDGPTQVDATATPDQLWPPNHELVPVTIAAAATSACDATVACRIVAVSSNESGTNACSARGDGHRNGDHSEENGDQGRGGGDGCGEGNRKRNATGGQDWIIDGDLTLRLRAERDGRGEGRDYVIEIACEDAAGNIGTTEVTVSVTHDQGKHGKR